MFEEEKSNLRPTYILKLQDEEKIKTTTKKANKKLKQKNKDFADFILLQKVVYFPFKALLPDMSEEEKQELFATYENTIQNREIEPE